jgi:hypothetical protein
LILLLSLSAHDASGLINITEYINAINYSIMEITSIHFGVFAKTAYSQEIYIEIRDENTKKSQIAKMNNIPGKNKAPNIYYEIDIPLTQNFTYVYGMTKSQGKEKMMTKEKDCYKEEIFDYRKGTLLNPFIEDEFGIIEQQTVIKLSNEPYIGKIIAICITTTEIKPNSIVMRKFTTADSYNKCTPEQLYQISVKLLDCLDQKETTRICCHNAECAQMAY